MGVISFCTARRSVRSGDTTPPILNLVTRWRWVVNLMTKWLKPGEESCDIKGIGRCMDFIFGLNSSETKNIISPLLGTQWWPLGYTVHGVVTTVTMLTQLAAARNTVQYSSVSVEMLRTELKRTDVILILLCYGHQFYFWNTHKYWPCTLFPRI